MSGTTCPIPKGAARCQFGYYFRIAGAVYGIDDLPDDDLLWRIEWIGGVGYNTNVPSDPLIDVCLAQLPVGETERERRKRCCFFEEIRCNVEGDNGTIGRVAWGYEWLAKIISLLREGIIIVAVHANR